MKLLKFLFVGIVFGIIMSKAEIISWFRIYEMFRFESFHMYGVMGSAFVIGLVFIKFIKKKKTKDIYGSKIEFVPKKMGVSRYLIGGVIFGLGWAMTGACPGPMFVLLGFGAKAFGIVILSATFGTFLYGILKNKLPH